MLNFWRNISRYPTFLVSAILGLVFGLFSPFQNKNIILFSSLFLGLVVLIVTILKQMLDL